MYCRTSKLSSSVGIVCGKEVYSVEGLAERVLHCTCDGVSGDHFFLQLPGILLPSFVDDNEQTIHFIGGAKRGL
jgi:hypothetical protein